MKRQILNESQLLKEGTSNFSNMGNLPLYVFYTYDEILYEMENDSDYPQEDDYYTEDGDFDEDAYEKAREEFEQDYWDKIDVTVLYEDEIMELDDAIDDLNRELIDKADDLEGEAWELDNEDNAQGLSIDEYNRLMDEAGVYRDIATFKVAGGYYAGAQIGCKYPNSYDELDKEGQEFVLGKLKEIGKRFGLTQLGVSYRFSNGETGYHKVEEAVDGTPHKDDYAKAVKKHKASNKKGSINNLFKLGGDPKKSMEKFNHMNDVTPNTATTGETGGDACCESKQINEGPGAGYWLEGSVSDIKVSKITEAKVEMGKWGTVVRFQVEAKGVFDGSCSSYYYGAKVKDNVDVVALEFDEMVLDEFDKENVKDIDVNDLNNYFNMYNVDFRSAPIGGGWSHSKFDGYAQTQYSDDLPYGMTAIGILFNDEATSFIDYAVQGENVQVEYKVDDEDEYFETEEEAIEYAKENHCNEVVKTEWYFNYTFGDEDTDDWDSKTVWTNDEDDDFYDEEDESLEEGAEGKRVEGKEYVIYRTDLEDEQKAPIVAIRSTRTEAESVARFNKKYPSLNYDEVPVGKFKVGDDFYGPFDDEWNKNESLNEAKDAERVAHYQDELDKLGATEEECNKYIKIADDYEEKASKGFISYSQVDEVANAMGLKSMTDNELARAWKVCYYTLSREAFREDDPVNYISRYEKYGDAASAFSEVINMEARARKEKGNFAPKKGEAFDLEEIVGKDYSCDTEGLLYLTRDAMRRIVGEAKDRGMSFDELMSMRIDKKDSRGNFGSLVLDMYETTFKNLWEEK